MLIEICSILGLSLWTLYPVLVAFIFLKEDEDFTLSDKFSVSFITFILFGGIGLALCLPGFIAPVKNIVTTYETPTSVIKTNNVTLVNHIVENELVIGGGGQLFSSASYWNSTNIMIKVSNGENFYGVKVSPAYEVILR
jgi:hypothetical protein